MTTIVIQKSKDGSYQGFYSMGHAGYAKKGEKDILCAAISILMIGANNALEALAGPVLRELHEPSERVVGWNVFILGNDRHAVSESHTMGEIIPYLPLPEHNHFIKNCKSSKKMSVGPPPTSPSPGARWKNLPLLNRRWIHAFQTLFRDGERK